MACGGDCGALLLQLLVYGVTNGAVVALPLLAMPDLLPAVELGGGGVTFTLKDALVLVLAGLAVAGVWLLLART